MELGMTDGGRAVSEDDIQRLHCSSRSESIRLFHQLARFGGETTRLTSAAALDKELEQKFHEGS